MSKQRILTGIKPTGPLHLGNYLGMVKELVRLQDEAEIFLMIADLHAQTVTYQPDQLRQETFELASSLIALGVDTDKVVFFRQSDVPAHTQLSWILGCLAPVGELMRMHEFKEQAERHGKEIIGAGILMYPVLMAADILLYRPNLVPVGEDQIQHLELMRELTRRFNRAFGETFAMPATYTPKETAKIMSLDEPTKKMSKSLPGGNLEIFASEAEIKKVIQAAVTDSDNLVRYDREHKPALSNLILIYKELTGQSYAEIEATFAAGGYGEFKVSLTEVFMKAFAAARDKKASLSKEKVAAILAGGANKAAAVANETLELVLQKTGLR